MGLHKTLPATIASLAKWSIDTRVSKTTTSNFPWPHNLSAVLSYDELQIKQRCLWGLQIPQLTPYSTLCGRVLGSIYPYSRVDTSILFHLLHTRRILVHQLRLFLLVILELFNNDWSVDWFVYGPFLFNGMLFLCFGFGMASHCWHAK